MDFGWTDAQLARRSAAAEFARRELEGDTLIERDHEGRFDRSLWEKCARFGILGLSVPPEFGGATHVVSLSGGYTFAPLSRA